MDVDVNVNADGLHPVSLRRTLIVKPLVRRKEREAETEPCLKLQNRSKSARSDGEIQEGFQEDQCDGARRSA
jgi:hypothetical protein